MPVNKFKNRKWDCDVSVRSGIPYTFPLFHGWNESVKKRLFGSNNFNMCVNCDEWISEIDLYTHNCSKDFQNIDKIDIEENIVEETEEEDPHPYVIATDENYESMRCNICQEVMKLNYLQDIEEWVFIDCVEYDGSSIHKMCYDVFYK